MTEFPRAKHEPCSEGCPSEMEIDQLEAGELSAEIAQALRERLNHCEGCQRRLAQRKAAFASAFANDRASVIARIAEQSAGPADPESSIWERFHSWLFGPQGRLLIGVAVAAALLIVFRPAAVPESPPDGLPGTRLKSTGLALTVIRYRNGRDAPLAPGGTLSRGDRVRFIVTTPRAGQLMIVGAEESGKLYPCYPSVELSATSKAVDLVVDKALEGAIEVDQSTGKERFIAILCKDSFSFRSLRADNGKLQISAGCTQTNVPFLKR